jgi:site-specific DNA-methyltransferase (adenine-specific)
MTEPTRRKITDYTPDPSNANRGTERGLRLLDDSIGEVGLGRSIVVDKHGTIIGGNKTAERAVDRGFEDAIEVETDGQQLVVVKRTDLDLSDGDDRARRLAYLDNRVAELDLDWQPEQLLADLESGVDLSGMFSDRELEELLGDLIQEDAPEDPDPQLDRAAELQEVWGTERGQVWEIGRHRLMCGDSTSAEDVGRLMDGRKANGCFTSPPYAEQRKEQYGGIAADDYVEWWEAIQRNVHDALMADASFFVNIKPHVEDGERALYVFDLVLAMRREWGWAYIDEFCWTRGGVPKMVKYRFKNAFEPIYQFAVTNKGFKFRPDAVKHDSYNVPVPRGEGAGNTNWAGWQGTASDAQGITGDLFGPHSVEGKAYPSNLIRPFSNREALGHPAAFAVELAEFFMKAYSDEGDAWIDPFCGSGTVVVSAEKNVRRGYGMEVLPEYVAVTLQRLADMGLEPRLVG